jgi:general secretion pathway protein C
MIAPHCNHGWGVLQTRTNEWMIRASANAPKLVTLVVAVLIAVELGRVAYGFINRPVKTPEPLPAAVATRSPHSGVNAQNIVADHLFGVAVAEPKAQDPANAPPSSANLMLAGTIATQDPKHGVAIVSDGGAPSKVYSVGDNVSGASLHSVYLDHVILDRNGLLETLTLPRQMPPARAPLQRRTGMVGSDPRTAVAVENIRHLVQQDPTILDQVMRTVPSYDSTVGKLRGFRAYPGRNRQIFNKLGLRPGDLVTAINGTTLDDPQRSQEVFNTIQSSDRVTVTIERAGQKQDITLNIAQVAAQATSELEGGQSGTPPGAGGNPPENPPPETPSADPNSHPNE